MYYLRRLPMLKWAIIILCSDLTAGIKGLVIYILLDYRKKVKMTIIYIVFQNYWDIQSIFRTHEVQLPFDF